MVTVVIFGLFLAGNIYGLRKSPLELSLLNMKIDFHR